MTFCPITADRDAWRGAVTEREAALVEALWLFREFTIRNATQWELGANHHHPIYPMIAELIGEMGGITGGGHYRFIQPDNREPLARAHTATDAEVDSGDDAPCTDCGDTGWMHQTERHCTCGAPASDAYDA